MNIKCIWLNERSQSGKATYCMIPFMSIGKGKTTETVKRSMIARSLGRTEAQTGKTQVIFFLKKVKLFCMML